MNENVLEIKNLHLNFDTDLGQLKAIRGVDLKVKRGEILCIVGESGCGKTVLCEAVMHILPKYTQITEGQIILNGEDITFYTDKQMRRLRGKNIAMAFQDPLTSLNPTIPVGNQIVETILKHEKISREAAKNKVLEILTLVGIENPNEMFNLQPHFFSGGMRQRIVLAVSLASNPDVLFADEITTALDVTVATKILDLLVDIKNKTNTSIVFISHDLGAVARIADRVCVMYAGKIVEVGLVNEIFYNPQHPYTWGLLSAHPAYAMKNNKLTTIPGMPPSLINLPRGDAFAVRNKYALEIDYYKEPPMFKVTDTHFAATWLLDEKAPKVKRPILFNELGKENKNNFEILEGGYFSHLHG